jgi:hypothetical protein
MLKFCVMNFKSMVVIIMLGWITTATMAQDKWERMINLQGRWKFSIGDKSLWSEKYFNDNKWEEIFVPSNWEDEGFNGYNGYAWYRKSFDGQDITSKDAGLSLSLGYIDDVDEVFFNGHKIGGSGGFPPRFHTAYNAARNYFIPKEFIDYSGRNVIAVRVYDSEIEGGIVSGNIGVYTNKSDRGLAVNLRGMWDFKLTETRTDRFASIDEKSLATIGKDGWETITVPGHWEHQGYNYDGSAWYRKIFMMPKDMQGEDLVLLLGKIDDSDKTFLNGKLIGSSFDSYSKLRIYHIPTNVFKAGQLNTMIVYVDDAQGSGGIVEGPVGIMKQSEFTRYIRWK